VETGANLVGTVISQAAGEDQARTRAGIIEYRLSRTRRILVDSPRDQHGEDPVAASDSLLNHLTVVCRTGNDCDAPFERLEFAHAALPADSDHLIAPVKRVLNHVRTEFSRCPNNADFHLFPFLKTLFFLDFP
jgi:hypothetical protein